MTGHQVRFLQVNTFYPQYLRDFYAARPALTQNDFGSQIDALLDDGFASSHIFTRPLRALGWESMQVIGNDPVSQLRWCHEKGIDEPSAPEDIVKLQVQDFEPDILYFTDIITFDSHFIRTLESVPEIVSGWRGFPSPPGTDWTAFDIVLTSFDRIMDEAHAFGAADCARFHPGFPEDCPVVEEERRIDWDVVFSGTVTREHQRRIAVLDMIAQLSTDPARPFSFGLFMPDASALPPHVQSLNQGARWADDMLRTLRNAQIVINVDVDAFGNQPPNMRLIEATGAGAFLLTPYHPNLKSFFTPGVEVETFRNEMELVSKLLFYLDNPDACSEIAAAGQARCLRDHGLKDRAIWFKDILERALQRKRAG